MNIYDDPALKAIRRQEDEIRRLYEWSGLKQLEEYKRAYEMSGLRHLEEMRQMMHPPAMDALDQIQALSEPISSSICEQIHSVATLPEYDSFRDMVREAMASDTALEEAKRMLSFIQSPAMESAQRLWEINYPRVAEASIITEQILTGMLWDRFDSELPLDTPQLNLVKKPFFRVLESYEYLLESFYPPNLSASLSPIVTALPAIEVYTEADLFSIVSEGEREYSKKEICYRKELAGEIEVSLEELLIELNPGLIRLWQGAKQAFKSKHSDSTRHVVVSLRELITHVLHIIAPDEKIRTWTSDPGHFVNDRPTRAARVFYVCRGINHGPFSDFVKADISSTVSFFHLFQRGTHELNLNFTDEQVGALILRTESLLRFLLETTKTGNY